MKRQKNKRFNKVALVQDAVVFEASQDQQTVPYDENLLERARVQWQFGDWHNLAQIKRETLQHHPDRAKLALLAAAGRLQIGHIEESRLYTRLAEDWGVSKKLMCQILVAGVHNSIGRAYATSNQPHRAHEHFEKAITIGSPSSDSRLLTQARITEQNKQIGMACNNTLLHKDIFTAKRSMSHGEISDKNNAEIVKTKLKEASLERLGKQYEKAEILALDILRDYPTHIGALQELAKIKEAKQEWDQAINLYDSLLKTQKVTIGVIIKRARIRKNIEGVEHAISDLEHASGLGLESDVLKYQLALSYRDNQQWELAESTIDSLLQGSPDYLRNNLSVATFSADLLRKRSRVKEAQVILESAVNAAKDRKESIPLITNAILEELNRQNDKLTTSSEVSMHFYNTIYEKSEKYQTDAENSIYLPVWKKVLYALEAESVRSILDIGCGSGQLAQYLINHIPGLEYIGLDYSKSAIRKAQDRCPTAQFIEADVMQNGVLTDYQQDVYLILEVLEHIERDCALLSQIPVGKKVIFSVPNFDSFGHVRFFKNEYEVRSRYENIFNNLSIEQINLRFQSRIYLGIGTRCASKLN